MMRNGINVECEPESYAINVALDVGHVRQTCERKPSTMLGSAPAAICHWNRVKKDLILSFSPLYGPRIPPR